ncbi:MAG: hypothetical protein JW774_08570, partial [Candidatus Aureabacteria bacterium]|nr:hypothetical protein [Candidatus Auribacterota bacterium]
MDTVIIGIHGLRNKPPKDLLADWWKKSIVEGFQAFQLPVLEFDFEMAYWAHYLNSKPQDGSITDTKDPQFLEEPYEPGTNFGPRDPNPFKKNISIGIHKQIFQLIAGKSAFMNIEAVSNIILHRMFVELDIYYHHDIPDEQGRSRPAKEILREELAGYLSRHAGKKILILAHSMGSIIAYDVLMHTVPDIPVQTLITFGAPLGFPVITTKIKHELNLDPKSDDLLPTPPSLKGKWLNFSDLDDVT